MTQRWMAWGGVGGGVLGALLGFKDWVVGPRVDPTQLSYPAAADEVWWTAGLLALVHAGAAAATWSVAQSDAGRVRGCRRWLMTASVAFLVMVPAELVYIPLSDVRADSAAAMVVTGSLGASAVAAGVGLTVAGVRIVTSGRWSGWRRFVVLLSGLWPLVVLTPVFVGSGWTAWPLVGWQVLLTAMPAAVLLEARPGVAGATGADVAAGAAKG